MTILKAYLIVLLIGLSNFVIFAVKNDAYGYNFVMMTTVIITSIIGSSVQITHKKMDYSIKGAEIIAIFSTGFFFAYFAYTIGDVTVNYLENKDNPILNPLHISGWISASTSFLSIKFLKFLQNLVENTLSGISINVIKAVTGFLSGFLKERDNDN